MLILTRKPGQVIHIGKDIRLHFLNVTKNRVMQVGIEAPDDIVILREEVRDKLLIDKIKEEDLFKRMKGKSNA